MKKALSIVMCYAIGMVAFALNAATPVSAFTKMDFHLPDLWGQTPRFGLSDSGIVGTQDAYYWCYLGEVGNISLIKNYEEGEKRYSGFGDAGEPNPQPSYMKSGFENDGFLDFFCLNPLLRTFYEVSASGDSESVSVPKTSDLFIDSLVKFVPRLESPETVLGADVKEQARFMCWLSAPEGAGVTNLVLTAGRYAADGTIYRANYVATNKVEVGRWYRLTARIINNASPDPEKTTISCCALYLDGVPVSCAEGDYAIGDDAAAMDALFSGNELYAARALFPPIHAFEGVSPRMSGLAVQGRGFYDEFGAVNRGNPIAYTTDVIDFVVTLSTNAVTNVVCTVTAKGETDPYLTVDSSGEAEVSFKVRPNDRVHVAPKADSKYSLAKALTLSGNRAAAANPTPPGYDVTMASSFSDATKLFARITTGNACFSVDGVIYESVVAAVEAAAKSGKVLIVENDVVLDPSMPDNGQLRVLPDFAVMLDLHGRMIRGENFREEATIYDQGRLTIIDSVGGGAIVAPGTVIEIVASNDALNVNHELAALTLGGEDGGDSEFTVTGRVSCTQGELLVRGGTYLTPPDLPDDVFYLADYTADNVLGDERCAALPLGDRLWRVSYDGRLLVKFAAEVGSTVPAYTNIDLAAGKTLVEPSVVGAAGYTVTNWVVKGSDPRVDWNFATDEVGESMTLFAQQRLNVYTISYDGLAGTPSTYTVRMPKTALPVPERARFVFCGWKDSTTGHTVDFVGEDAVFVDAPDVPVTGDLALVSQWAPAPIKWSNATDGHSESNGTYSGSWAFCLPASPDVPSDANLVVDEIAFCIVNPLLYPKTAEYLVVTNAAGAVFSAKREYGFDTETQEYLVGTNVLANGRAQVSYRFDGLHIKPGATYGVCFSSSADAIVPVMGFLRLALVPDGDDPVFGNCTRPGGDPLSAAYLDYCPVYEVTGHLEGVE